jgi:hypothetical protein
MSTSIRALVGPKALQTPWADNSTSVSSAMPNVLKSKNSIGGYRNLMFSFSEKRLSNSDKIPFLKQDSEKLGKLTRHIKISY